MSDREKRNHTVHSYRSKFGKSTVEIDCPFCSGTTTAFVWSLAGGGKKCSCGALHGGWGFTYAPKPKLKLPGNTINVAGDSQP